MRVEILYVCALTSALWAGDSLAADRCKRDADCVFAFRSPCFCAPCGDAKRTASTRERYKQIERGWAIKVPRCRACKRCKQPTTWLGAEAVCRKGRCEVTGAAPRPLRSLINVGINRIVYTLRVEFRDGEFMPVKVPRMPYHHASRFEWHGGQLSRAARKVGRRHRFDFIITRREIHKVSGRRQWRATYHARVVLVSPTL